MRARRHWHIEDPFLDGCRVGGLAPSYTRMSEVVGEGFILEVVRLPDSVFVNKSVPGLVI